MNDNVTSLPGVRKHTSEPNEALVKTLQDLLERAQTGYLQSFIGVGYCLDGARAAIWVDCHDNVYEMLGSIAWLEHEYVARHVEAKA